MSQRLTFRLTIVTFVCFAAGITASFAQPTLTIQPGAYLSWPTQTNDNYQLQYYTGSGGSWSSLGSIVAGNGATNSYYDPADGSRTYRVLQIVPGTPASSGLPTNGGFESGTGSTASGWTVSTAAGGPVSAGRSNDTPHGGSYDFQVHLASTGSGPVVEFNQSGIPVTAGTTYPFTFYANALSGSAGYSGQWRIVWSPSGTTGYVGFTPGNNTYALISNSVTAPTGATSATIYIHLAGAAITNQTANVDFDDVALGSGTGGAGTPATTNALPVTMLSVAQVSWPTTVGTQYQPESTTSLTQGTWNTNYTLVVGDGGVHSIIVPMTNSAFYFRIYTPFIVVQPPGSLEQISSGITGAIGLAWSASPTPGVTGYRILYGTTSGSLTNAMNVGNVNSAVITGLTPGQTYYVSIITLTSTGQSVASQPTISAQPDTSSGVVPLYNAGTVLEPDTFYTNSTALVTEIADRPRARHARESEFMLYDTYLIFYWQQRMTDIQIIDTFPKGGSNITFNISTLNALDQPNIRFFFQGQTTVAQYSDNLFAEEVDSTGTNWTMTIDQNITYNRPLKMGDRVEVEFSPFMLTVTNGQLNYYGGAMLYVVGQGIIPWQEGVTNDAPAVNAALDSTPIPTNGWLAGRGTMPYQYSTESNHVFNQLSPAASPPSGQTFLLGRRLHETDFGDGTHAEGGNPVYPEQIGKLGPKFSNRSCVACHANNGRALPPAIGAPMIQSLVRVGSDASGTPDPVLGSVLSPQITNGTPEGSVSISSYTSISGQYGDGTAYTLQKPNYTFGGYTPAFFSVRLAPQLVGMGLLEAISESTVTQMASADQSGSNGVFGSIQTVVDPENGQPRLGRFGYKASKARISHQIAGALNSDMGVTTSIFPVLDGQTNSGPVELAGTDLTNWVRYISSLGVNARRNLTDAQCLLGEQLFATANCTQCHTPTITTSPFHPIAELRNQTIHPYTDLLLHDMGPGLADNMGEANASGSQWRTSPLWSIGLTPGTAGGEAYLHDGRARSFEEAILWHDGEGAASKEVFRNMSASDRTALVAFLKSL